MGPLVSVLMTAYNRERYISEAIDSVLASAYPHFELIIVDDGSKDNTVSIARKYAVQDKRITVYVNERNLGDYPNRNRAASYANGEFIMYCDSDDTFLPSTLQDCVSEMLQHPEVSFGMYWLHSKIAPFVLAPETAIHQHFFECPFLYIGPGGTIIRRAFFEEIKGFPEKYGPANDAYYNLKCSARTPILMLPFEFVVYRRHEGQEINNTYSYLYNLYLYLRDALEELDLHLTPKEKRWVGKKNKRRFFVNLVRFCLKTRDVKKARDLIQRTNFGYKDVYDAIF
jgi:glycosyltransferase involved in cell wall biosynthesis